MLVKGQREGEKIMLDVGRHEMKGSRRKKDIEMFVKIVY